MQTKFPKIRKEWWPHTSKSTKLSRTSRFWHTLHYKLPPRFNLGNRGSMQRKTTKTTDVHASSVVQQLIHGFFFNFIPLFPRRDIEKRADAYNWHEAWSSKWWRGIGYTRWKKILLELCWEAALLLVAESKGGHNENFEKCGWKHRGQYAGIPLEEVFHFSAPSFFHVSPTNLNYICNISPGIWAYRNLVFLPSLLFSAPVHRIVIFRSFRDASRL